MESEFDIPCEYSHRTPYVTIDEMKKLLRSRIKNGQIYELHELEFDKQSGLYYTNYFSWGDNLLQLHLLAEQCIINIKMIDWLRTTDSYDTDTMQRILDLMQNPLVWIDDIPDELETKFIVTGRVATEKSSEERYIMSPCNDLFFDWIAARREWFANKLPKAMDIPTYSGYNVPKDMIVWDRLLTDPIKKWHSLHLNPDKKYILGNAIWPYCSPLYIRREINSIYDHFGAQKAAQIVRLLREDWQDIKVLKLFGIDELTPEQIEEFRQCIFEGMDRSLRAWDDETPKAETPKEESPDHAPTSAPGKPRGPKTQYLFADVRGNEDTFRSKTEAERVRKFVADHRMGNMQLDSQSTNRLNLMVACFWYRWNERGWVSQEPQGAAIYRFFTEQCELECAVLKKAFSTKICKIINEGKKDYQIYDDLDSYFRK